MVYCVWILINFDQNPGIHDKKLTKQPQLEMFKTVLTRFLDPEHEFCLLAKKIDWEKLEKGFTPLFGTVGKLSLPIRTIVGLLLLKQMYS